MITESEIQAAKLSPVKKDFYQIWTELLDTASKISARWDPTSTNESDPGIVLLKVLTACSDKLNYNIDKNILEAFMPSATQLESMRRLCEMMGYNMKYYQSAKTAVTFTYNGEDKTVGSFTIPRYTAISDSDNTINYVTLKDAAFYVNEEDTSTLQRTSVEVTCIEGQAVAVTTDNDNLVSLRLLDDKFRYYLPETQIAENGIFVTLKDSTEEWIKVDNLNTQATGTKCFKFGFDSTSGQPFLQFPTDIGDIIGDGLNIVYIRTSGSTGNIAAKTLSTITSFNSSSTIEATKAAAVNNSATESTVTTEISPTDFIVINYAAATSGKDLESLDDAYNSYKKVIGTFDTLVTCRDYMNKIYQLFDDVNTPLVSNIIVSDLRDDINNAYTLCTFNEYGIKYVDKAPTVDGKEKINNFDLMLYPFTTVYGLNTESEYKNSFKYSTDNIYAIESALKDYKTISHNYRYPLTTDIVCIKNYLKLNARITTTYKVNVAEEAIILAAVKASIYRDFNLRKLDFGEELPFDSILATIEGADSRIKNVSLEEPKLYTAIELGSGEEILLSSEIESLALTDTAKKYLNKLTLRNILAGKVSLYNYDIKFAHKYSDAPYGNEIEKEYTKIISLESAAEIPGKTGQGGKFENITLTEGEVISFRAPNFKTVMTYPAYVNYYLYLKDSHELKANCEYQLQSDEYLLINYTSSVTSEDGTSTDVVYNLKYDPGTILRANIDLKDSVTTHTAGSNWAKTSGFDFSKWGLSPDGMFSFGVKEQLEIRDKVTVTLSDSLSYVYWTLNENNTGEFPFENDEYLLQEGEYFWYTTQDKLSLSYYGMGTLIKRNKADPVTLYKAASQTEVLLEDILEKGVSGIPWIVVSLSNSKYIKLEEYQYINLTAGDTLIELTTKDKSVGKLSSTPKPVQSAKYKIVGSEEADVPTFLPPTSSYATWEVFSKLEYNMGPAITQTLYNTYDKITLKYGSEESRLSKTLQPTRPTGASKAIPLGIRLNHTLKRSTTLPIICKTAFVDSFGNPVQVDLMTLKTSEVVATTTTGSPPVPLNNQINWTSLAVDNPSYLGSSIDLNISIPDNKFGLIMFYYMTSWPIEKESLRAYLTASAGTTSKTLVICNYPNSQAEAWWTGYNEDSKYYVREGINIVKLASDITKLTIHIPNTDGYDHPDGAIIFGDLDIIDGINPKLNYQSLSDKTVETTLYDDIRELDENYDFYYNTLVDTSTLIDLSADDALLTNPRVLYDYNNINNKFVISEISAEKLDGIAVAKSSKV